MSDLINRQAAIDAIDELVSTMSVCVSTDECRGMNWMKRRAIVAIEALPTIDPVKWIPVSERLPEEGKQVLVCDDGGFIYTAEYEVSYDGEPRWYESVEYRPMDDVIAWMPLPEPWKAEEDG